MVSKAVRYYGYVRHAAGDMPDEPLMACHNYFERRCAHDPAAKFVGFYIDWHSQANVALCRRYEGQLLSELLERGDQVIIADTYKAFQGPQDCLWTIKYWGRRGVTTHLLELDVVHHPSDNDPACQSFLQSVAIAERWVHAIPSEVRKSKARPFELAHGGAQTHGGRCPLGYKILKRRGFKYDLGGHVRRGKRTLSLRIPDHADREVMAEIERLRDAEQLSWGKISDRIEQRLSAAERRAYVPNSAFKKRAWSASRCRHACAAVKRIRQEHEGWEACMKASRVSII
jgi:hypothetical protein